MQNEKNPPQSTGQFSNIQSKQQGVGYHVVSFFDLNFGQAKFRQISVVFESGNLANLFRCIGKVTPVGLQDRYATF